jgi:hypothetical protein
MAETLLSWKVPGSTSALREQKGQARHITSPSASAALRLHISLSDPALSAYPFTSFPFAPQKNSSTHTKLF